MIYGNALSYFNFMRRLGFVILTAAVFALGSCGDDNDDDNNKSKSKKSAAIEKSKREKEKSKSKNPSRTAPDKSRDSKGKDSAHPEKPDTEIADPAPSTPETPAAVDQPVAESIADAISTREAKVKGFEESIKNRQESIATTEVQAAKLGEEIALLEKPIGQESPNAENYFKAKRDEEDAQAASAEAEAESMKLSGELESSRAALEALEKDIEGFRKESEKLLLASAEATEEADRLELATQYQKLVDQIGVLEKARDLKAQQQKKTLEPAAQKAEATLTERKAALTSAQEAFKTVQEETKVKNEERLKAATKELQDVQASLSKDAAEITQMEQMIVDLKSEIERYQKLKAEYEQLFAEKTEPKDAPKPEPTSPEEN